MLEISDFITDSARSQQRSLSIFGVRLWWPFPVAAMLGSSCAMVFGTPVYGGRKRGWVRPVFRVFRRIDKARHWVSYRFTKKHSYHIVLTDLEPGYYDVDTLMLHACMVLLCRYVEIEHGGEQKLSQFASDLQDPAQRDPNGPEGVEQAQGERDSEAVQIYRWWKVTRPANEKRRDELLHILFGNRRLETKPTEHPNLVELVPPTFNDTQEAMYTEFRALEEKIAADEQTMLHRLITIRRGLWT